MRSDLLRRCGASLSPRPLSPRPFFRPLPFPLRLVIMPLLYLHPSPPLSINGGPGRGPRPHRCPPEAMGGGKGRNPPATPTTTRSRRRSRSRCSTAPTTMRATLAPLRARAPRGLALARAKSRPLVAAAVPTRRWDAVPSLTPPAPRVVVGGRPPMASLSQASCVTRRGGSRLLFSLFSRQLFFFHVHLLPLLATRCVSPPRGATGASAPNDRIMIIECPQAVLGERLAAAAAAGDAARHAREAAQSLQAAQLAAQAAAAKGASSHFRPGRLSEVNGARARLCYSTYCLASV